MKSVLILAAGAIAIGGPAHAQDGELRASIGAAYKTQELAAEGAILGSLAPRTPFSATDDGHRFVLAAGAGYDHYLGRSFFLGADLGVELGNFDRSFAATASASASQIVERCFPPPPGPGVPPFCVPFGTFTRTFAENQSLTLNVETGPAATLTGRAGVALGRVRAWVFGGGAAQRARIAYDLPALTTVAPPIAPFVTVGLPPLPSEQSSLPPTIVLPAEQRFATRRLTGWTAGIGLEHRVSDRLALLVRYAYADYGSATVAGTARLAPIRIASKSQSFSLALSLLF